MNIGDPLITLETEKAAMDIPSPFTGKVVSLFVELGVKISEGDNICELLSEDSDVIKHEKEKTEEQLDEELLPFGFIDTGGDDIPDEDGWIQYKPESGW
mgnify:CR=1 FL=1